MTDGAPVSGGPQRLFVAAWPSADVLAALAAVHRPAGERVRWSPSDKLHVTLHFLGETDPDDAVERLGTLRSAPAEAEVEPTVRLLARSALVLPVRGVDDLAQQVRRALGISDTRPFLGHLTVGRLRKPGSLLGVALPDFGRGHRWTVNEVTLVRSDLDPGGARYTVVSRVALA